MDLKEAMSARHTVRQYTEQPLGDDVLTLLETRIAEMNSKHGITMKLVVNNRKGIMGIMKLVARNVMNYIVIGGDEAEDLGVRAGYASADIMLYAQTLGLCTWWIGGTYNHSVAHLIPGKKTLGVVTVGYGATQGTPHKSKLPSEVSFYKGETPEWFKCGIAAALLAPTALNKQGFQINGEGNKVSITYAKGTFSGVDTGIVKYHFELGAGKENFVWE